MHKIIQKGYFDHFPQWNPFSVPASVFESSSTCLCKLFVKFCLKIILVCIRVSLSQSEAFLSQGHFGLFILLDFWAERYFKMPHFDNLFVLVHFVSFNCFTLRYFQVTFLLILLLFASQSIFYFYLQNGPFYSFLAVWSFFFFLQFSPLILQICKKVLKSNSVQRPRRQYQSRCHMFIGSKATCQPI